MNALDLWVLHIVNGHVGQWPVFDGFALYLANSNLLKMFPMVLVLTGLWFERVDDTTRRRDELVRIFFGTFIAMAGTRSLTHLLPFRNRPIHDAAAKVLLHGGVKPEFLDGMSSLPSDHAGLAFALAMGIFFLNRHYGKWALTHATLLICLPRLYFGFHYLTDLIVGALIGIFSSWVALRLTCLNRIAFPLLQLEAKRPAIFYALFFFSAYQTADMYEDTRAMTRAVGSSLYDSIIAAPATDRGTTLSAGKRAPST